MLRLAILLAGVLAFAGCGGGDEARVAAGWRLPVRTPDPPAAANWTALILQPLHFDAARRCVLLGGTPAVFPVGTVVLDDPLRLRLADGRIIHEGDPLTSSGGAAPTVDWIPDVANADEAQRCTTGTILVLPQALTDVKVGDP